jgi:hypothetical protein
MKLLRIMLIVFAIGISNSAFAVTVRGFSSCGTWVADHAEPNETARRLKSGFDETWLIGFLSGIAFAANIDILKDNDNDSIYLWMDNYCKAHPLDAIYDGADKLATELLKRLPKK